MRTFGFSTLDGKLFVYQMDELKIRQIAEDFPTEILFTLTDDEAGLLTEVEMVVDDNLKKDFIYFTARINGQSYWTCTCGGFLETDANGEDSMLKQTLRHARKSGHTINPRGN